MYIFSFRSIRKDPRRVTFKDVTEDMIPAAMEKMRPVTVFLLTKCVANLVYLR